jgi:hypothetical protein
VHDRAKRRSPHFIIDEPATDDFFETHSALVDAIARTIKSDDRIRTIGLIGRWGIGKSTVITKLDSAVTAEKDKYVFFTYDAWAHQSDPPRRSLLEELIGYVLTTGATARTDWTAELRELAGQLEYSSSRKTPYFSPLAKALIFSVIPIPFVYSLVDSDLLSKVFTDNPDLISRYILIAAILLTMLPILIVGIAYLCTRPWGNWADKSKKLWTASPDVLSLVITRTAEKSNTTTIKQNEPTAIEFQKTFKNIIGSLKGKRLIVVIDNLDRLPAREALSIWSVMIGFFTNHISVGPDPKLPVVILPIDAHSLAEILGEGDSGKSASRALVEKTFDIVFELPEPVLSDWRDYLAMRAHDVFGAEADNETVFWLSKNFEQKLVEDKNPPITPRRINRFLNRVAALRLQQEEEFPIGLVALYVAQADKIADNLLAFLATHSATRDYPENWQTVISAIHFGVKVTKASLARRPPD